MKRNVPDDDAPFFSDPSINRVGLHEESFEVSWEILWIIINFVDPRSEGHARDQIVWPPNANIHQLILSQRLMCHMPFIMLVRGTDHGRLSSSRQCEVAFLSRRAFDTRGFGQINDLD